MTIRLKSAHYLYLGFFISIIFLLIYSNPCHSEPSDKEQWVNLYNLTGIEEPEIMDVSFHGDIACIQDTDSSTAELWDIKNEKLIKRLYLRGVLSDIEFSPNGSLIAIGRGPGFESIGLVIYWSSNGTEIPGTHVHIQNYTDDLDWTSDGKRIALGTEKGEIYLINTTTWSVSQKLVFDSTSRIFSIAYSPDDSKLGFLASNGTCTIIDATTFEVLKTFPASSSNFNCDLTWSYDGRLIAFPYPDGYTIIYNTSTFSLEKQFQHTHMVFSPTRYQIIIGYGVGDAQTLSVENWEEVARFHGIVGPVDLIACSGDGNTLLLGSSEDTTIRAYIDILSSAYNNPPKISIQYPGPNQVVGTRNVFYGTAEDDGRIEFVIGCIDSSSWLIVNGTNNWTWLPDFENLSNGHHTFFARAFDGKYFSATCSTTFILDIPPGPNSPPWISILFPPNNFIANQSFPVYGFCGDDESVEKIFITYANLGAEIVPEENGFWQWIFPWEDLKEGSYKLSVRAFDGELFSEYSNATIGVIKETNGRRPPLVTVIRPVNLEIVQGIVVFQGTVYSSEPDGIVIIEIDGLIRDFAIGYHNWSYSYDTREIAPGYHNISIWAFDGVLLSPKVELILIVEPYQIVDIILESPQNNSEVKGIVNCTGQAVGADFIYSVFLQVDSSEEVKVNGTRSWHHRLDTNPMEDGLHQLRLWAVYAGGESNPLVVFVTVNNSGITNAPPVVRILKPTDGSKIHGNIIIEGVAEDDVGVESVQAKIDEGAWFDVEGQESWQFSFDTDTYSYGMHRIQIRASDGELFSDIVSHEYEIVETGVPRWRSGLAWIVVIIIIIIIIVLALRISKIFSQEND